jgi:large repetitive protein
MDSISNRASRFSATLFALASIGIAASTQASDINIWGAPQTAVYSGANYNFRPSVSGTQRTVSFRISNKPAWLSFSSSTGRLYGTPNRWNIGTYSDIVISATDGRTTDRLAAFSIKVPNRRPVISGAPLTSVIAGQSYSFQPYARDADGHTLRFSVQNKPGWATFSSSSGRLAGTPASG